jgi:type IX secretion system PorP/SprF family membrane protein
MKKHYISLCAVLLSFISNAQQDPQYSLYQFNPLIINPAYAGARDGLSTVASIRNQWSGFSDLRTICLSLHKPILSKKLGVGLTLVNDKIGPRNATGVYANAAYLLKLTSKLKLSFGLNVGFNRYQYNYSKITFSTAEIPADFSQNQTQNLLDLNSGVYLKSNSFFAGISISHLNRPSVYRYGAVSANTGSYSYTLRNHIFITAGKSFMLNDNLIFAPTLLIKNVKAKTSADINANFFIQKKLWLGAFYRFGYGPGGLLQYYVTNKLRVAYSYDTGLNDARRLGGSHEVMLGFDFSGTKTKMMNPRFL